MLLFKHSRILWTLFSSPRRFGQLQVSARQTRIWNCSLALRERTRPNMLIAVFPPNNYRFYRPIGFLLGDYGPLPAHCTAVARIAPAELLSD